jgi:hypothetical protein
MDTNANSPLIAALLADSRLGTFTGIVTKKKGFTRGKGSDKKTFGDATVHCVIFTGFKYDNLVRRSAEMLPTLDAVTLVAEAAKHGKVFTVADVEEARAELAESFAKTLAGTNESTTDHVFSPLVVDGENVRGARVYKCVTGTNDDNGEPRVCHCRNCTGDDKAPLPGTIYLTGLRIYSKELIPAPNGDGPATVSAPKTMAKDALRFKLPVSKFVQHILEPGTDFVLNAGGTAAVEATKNGFVVTDEVVDALRRVAA